MDAARPTQTVDTSGRMCRIVSKTAMPAGRMRRATHCPWTLSPSCLAFHAGYNQKHSHTGTCHFETQAAAGQEEGKTGQDGRWVGQQKLTCGDGAAGGVDVHGDVPVGRGRVQVQQLCDDHVRHVIVHGAAHAHDALRLQQATLP